MPVFRLVLAVWAAALAIVGLGPVLSAQADAGGKVYAAQKCGICHSIAGVGNKKSPLDGVGARLTEEQIREWIVNPGAAAAKAKSTARPTMPAYKSLSAAELDALVAYMKSLGRK